MSEPDIELSIVMPCLNEARTLGICLQKAKHFLSEHNVKGEIVVADNDSDDGSQEIAKSYGAQVVSVKERGYGAALAGGIAAARGRYIIMGDADDSYSFAECMPILEKLREGYALVMGNRFKGGIERGAMPFLNRYLGNPVLSALGKLFFRIPVGDFHCGLRGFSREAISNLELQTTGMEYASEMIVSAALHGLPMTEVPVTLRPDGRGHKSHLSPWRDGWRHLRFLLLYSPRWLYLYPGLAMIVIGLLLAGLVLPGPFMIADGVGLDVHTLLVSSMAILLGVQSITFGFIARSYATRNGVIPQHASYEKLLEGVTLEHMLLLSAVLIVLGLIGVGWATHLWSSAHFGALNYRDAMRVLIVAVTCIVAGFQLGFAGFLLGVMQISRKK